MKLALIAGFLYPVEVECKTRFGRLFSVGSIVWFPRGWCEEKSVSGRFADVLERCLTSGATSMLVLLSENVSADVAEPLADCRTLVSTTSIEDRILHPMDANRVRRELTRFFGPDARDPEITDDTLRSALGGRKVVCVSARGNNRFRHTFGHTSLASKDWTFDEFRYTHADRVQMLSTLRAEADKHSRLLYASSGLGGLPPSVTERYSGRVHIGGQVIEVVQSFFRFLADEQQHSEIRRAGEIQEALLPQSIPSVPPYEISPFWCPVGVVGGDYYDTFRLKSGNVALVIADVSGKGLPAAMLMSNLQGTLRALASEGLPPSVLCERVNDTFCGHRQPGQLITFFYSELDPQHNTLAYTNAGHNPPILRRADGALIRLSEGGLLLGVRAQTKYKQDEVTLEAEDCLLLFTDGITEACDANGEHFGDERLAILFKRTDSARADSVRDVLVQAITEFCAGEFLDDAALVVVKVCALHGTGMCA